MPSSDQMVWTSSPSRSPIRASSASDHGACTRPPNGLRMHSRQSPSSSRNRSTTIALVGRQDAGDLAFVVEVGEQVGRGQLVEVVRLAQARVGDRATLRAAREVGLELADEGAQRPPELDRPPDRVALPERQLARDARRRADRDPVRTDVVDPPAARAEDDDVAVHPGTQLVDHLLVELADPPAGRAGLAGHEHAEQAPVRDRAAARDRDDPSVAPALDDVGHPVPDDARLELGELVGRVGAGEHAEHAFEDLAGQRLVRQRPGSPR